MAFGFFFWEIQGKKRNWIKISLPVDFCGPFVGNLADFNLWSCPVIHLTKCGNCPICYFNKWKSSTDRVQVFISPETSVWHIKGVIKD